MKRTGILFFLLYGFNLSAQLPQTEIYVFDLSKDQMGYHLSNMQKVKVADGYNNQPFFTRDGKYMLFTASGKKKGKTDIYRYDLEKKKIRQLTKTKKQSEYSPKLTPNQEGISCVRVEEDTTQQHLYVYNLKGKKPKQLLKDVHVIGYYEWITLNDLLTFNIPEPFTLNYYSFQPAKQETLYPAIGRDIKNIRNKLFYVDKRDSLHWYIKELDKRRIGRRNYDSIPDDEMLTETLPGEEDYAFMQDGSIIMGHLGQIFQKEKVIRDHNKEWKMILDLSPYYITRFYRITVSPNFRKLAVVAYVGEKP